MQGESVQGPSPSVLLRCSQGQVQPLLAAPPVEFIWENPVAPEESGARWKRSWQELLEHSWEPPNVLPFHPAASCVPFSPCGSDELWYVGTGLPVSVDFQSRPFCWAVLPRQELLCAPAQLAGVPGTP